MNNSVSNEAAARRASAKSVALPAEKGSWSLVSEPILLGLLAAPSWAGAALAVGAFATFLCNRPLKVYLADRRRGRVYERTALARRYLALYAAIAVAGFAGGLALGGWRPFAPLAAAVPLLARAVWGLSAWRWRISVIALGFLETGFGVLAVLLVAIGSWLR